METIKNKLEKLNNDDLSNEKQKKIYEKIQNLLDNEKKDLDDSYDLLNNFKNNKTESDNDNSDEDDRDNDNSDNDNETTDIEELENKINSIIDDDTWNNNRLTDITKEFIKISEMLNIHKNKLEKEKNDISKVVKNDKKYKLKSIEHLFNTKT